MKRIILVGLVLAVTTAACGRSNGSDSTGSSVDHNDADLAFAQEMVAHHEQAVVMAQMAQDQASTEVVRGLARRIEKGQNPEIETMQSWLEEWGESEDSDDMGGMDHGDVGGSEMDGLLSEDEMGELASLAGKIFDRTFLRMMIEHHEGAIARADEEIENGESSEAVDLAQAIASTQENEVDEMRSLLQDLR